jgi:hypothetical protein
VVTFGCHESYLYRTVQRVMARNIIPHLVTRTVYTGAGGLDASSPGIRFLVSPRARFVRQPAFNTQGSDRGIFHGKDESLGGPGMRRLHVVCGESLCSEWADYLRMGTTALIVALIDAGVEAGLDVHFDDPFTALQRLSRDAECRALLPVPRRRLLTACRIQRHYLQRVSEHLGSTFLPDWAETLCERWRSTLDRLEQDPSSLSRTLDWPLKLALFRDHARRRGFSWDRLRVMTRMMPPPVASRDDLFAENLTASAGDRTGPRASSPVSTRQARGTGIVPFDEAELAAFHRLRTELFEIDTRFSQLGTRGIFAALDRAGVLEHRIVDGADVDRAVSRPPAGSRARQRGRVIRCLAGRPQGITCAWGSVFDGPRKRVLELTDPCGRARPHWRSLRRRDLSDALPF